MPESSPRRRGAPSGNQNALKHGFYSKLFPKAVTASLPPTDAPLDFTEEVQMMRLTIHRVLELSQNVQQLPEAIGLLRALSVASSSLTRLAAAQRLLKQSSREDDRKTLAEIVAEIQAEMEADGFSFDDPAPLN